MRLQLKCLLLRKTETESNIRVFLRLSYSTKTTYTQTHQQVFSSCLRIILCQFLQLFLVKMSSSCCALGSLGASVVWGSGYVTRERERKNEHSQKGEVLLLSPWDTWFPLCRNRPTDQNLKHTGNKCCDLSELSPGCLGECFSALDRSNLALHPPETLTVQLCSLSPSAKLLSQASEQSAKCSLPVLLLFLQPGHLIVFNLSLSLARWLQPPQL